MWPVMVFVAGGAFAQGTGSSPLYDGSFIANKTGAIVVNFNYRLGALGYLATEGGLTGNYGLYDQLLLLQWVQSNIQYFGGNPAQVTLFGESAGAASVMFHLLSPLSTGLFHRAIMESNYIGLPYKSNDEMYLYADTFSGHLGCKSSDLECLRSKSADDIVTAADNTFRIPDPFHLNFTIALTFEPTIDGKFVPDQPIILLQQGKFQKMPIMLGNNLNEGIMFIYEIFTKPLDSVGYAAAILAFFGLQNERNILNMYPVPVDLFDDTRMQLSNVITDYGFTCSVRYMAELFYKFNSGTGNQLYWYNFQHVISFSQAWGPNFTFCDDYVCHGSELPFVFHSAKSGGFSFTPQERVLSEQMVLYWTSFANGGTANPNSSGRTSVQWPAYSPEAPAALILDIPIHVNSTFLQDTCNYWDRLGYLF